MAKEGLEGNVIFGRAGHQQETQLNRKVIPQPKRPFAAW